MFLSKDAFIDSDEARELNRDKPRGGPPSGSGPQANEEAEGEAATLYKYFV